MDAVCRGGGDIGGGGGGGGGAGRAPSLPTFYLGGAEPPPHFSPVQCQACIKLGLTHEPRSGHA